VSRLLGKFDCSTGITTILHRAGDLLVRTATVKDLLFIDKLQRENSQAVGFIQRTIWDQYVFGGERNFTVFLCEKNDDAVGYVLVTPGRGANSYVRIQQIVVRDDARRLDYGTALLAVVRQLVEHLGRAGARLRCRVDLEANRFWEALGFRQYGLWRKGMVNHVGMTASDDILLWEVDLNRSIPRLFDLDDEMWVPDEGSSNLSAR
jgi:GNAT superfamily N-acetyltransferase